MTKNLTWVFIFLGLTCGLVIGILASTMVQPKQTTLVNINSESGTVSFQSNRLKDGDQFFVIMGADTISRGIVIDGRWKQ